MTKRISGRDLPWVALIFVSFTVGLALSWERWGNPLVDCGREMNQPLRLVRGEMLYSDVRHIYGPLSPYLNAALYDLFGPSLNVLYGDGIITAIIILALIYWLSRQLMNPLGATAATLSVLWLCAFKQAGNYVLPYSYSALHACALGLATLALTIKYIEEAGRQTTENGQRKTDKYFLLAAGVMAGLTTLAKTEMGVAALIAGALGAALAGRSGPRRRAGLIFLFAAPAITIVIGVYGYIASRVSWHTLSNESFLFFRNLPEELVYFNLRMSGFDQPAESLVLMMDALLRIVVMAVTIASVSLMFAIFRRSSSKARIDTNAMISDAGRAGLSPLWMMMGLGLLLSLALLTATFLHWEKGPYLAMPLLLIFLLIWALINSRNKPPESRMNYEQSLVLVVTVVFSLASLARVMFRVRSGGAYSSYLIPASVVLFTYWWIHPFADLFRNHRARRVAQAIAIGLILLDVAATSVLLTHRFRKNNTYRLVTPRGTMMAVPDIGEAFDKAIAFINERTRPGEPVAVMPEGTSLNFFTDRPNPLREEITTPGFLDAEGEKRAIKQLIESDTRLVLITNRPTPEFGHTIFGHDYCQGLMQWIEENFEAVAVIGPDQNSDLQIGNKTFFIRAYVKK